MKQFKKYLERPNAAMPSDHIEILKEGKAMAADKVLPRNEVNQLFHTGYLKGENGFRRFEDGSAYTAVLTQMPNVTIDMINWWFWWHAKTSVRYQIWYPDMHYDIDADFQGYYEDATKTYSERLHLSRHLVTEDVGLGKDKILIDFMHPAAFGFDNHKLDANTTIICARVGSPDKGVWGTEMCHFVRTTKQGVEMRSRFWLGQKIERINNLTFLNGLLNQSFVKRRLLPKALGYKMFHHCSQEYHNLAEILPELYREFS